jgi:hypothetical protein
VRSRNVIPPTHFAGISTQWTEFSFFVEVRYTPHRSSFRIWRKGSVCPFRLPLEIDSTSLDEVYPIAKSHRLGARAISPSEKGKVFPNGPVGRSPLMGVKEQQKEEKNNP